MNSKLKKLGIGFFILISVYVLSGGAGPGFAGLTTASPVFAANPTNIVSPGLGTTIKGNINNATTPFSQKDITVVIGIIINAVLGVIGVVFLILLVYAGFRWLLAKGEDGEIKKARGLIEHSIIGLVIIVGCFVVVRFVLSALQKVF